VNEHRPRKSCLDFETSHDLDLDLGSIFPLFQHIHGIFGVVDLGTSNNRLHFGTDPVRMLDSGSFFYQFKNMRYSIFDIHSQSVESA